MYINVANNIEIWPVDVLFCYYLFEVLIAIINSRY